MRDQINRIRAIAADTNVRYGERVCKIWASSFPSKVLFCLPARIYLTWIIILELFLIYDKCNRKKRAEFFPLRKKHSPASPSPSPRPPPTYISALLSIRKIMQLFIPYSIRGFHYVIHCLIREAWKLLD